MLQRYAFNNVATHGIIKDALPTELPQDAEAFAWSDGQNVRFNDGKVQKTKGETLFWTTSAAPAFLRALDYSFGSDKQQWAWEMDGGGLRVLSYNGNVIEVTISTIAVSTVADICIEPIAPNRLVTVGSNRTPYVVDWSAVTISSRTNLMQYDTAETFFTAGIAPLIIRRFGQFLIAIGDLSDTTGQGPNTIRWSTTVGSDGVPTTWNPATEGELAGSTKLLGGAGYGRITDMVPLRDTGMIYKARSTWGMQATGNNDVFRFFEIFSDLGAIETDCVGVLDDEHVVFGHDDIYIHNGVNYKRLLSKRMRKTIFDELNWDATGRIANVAVNRHKGEVWLAYAADTANWPNKVLIYNYEEDTIGDRVLTTTTRYMTYGRMFATAMSGASTVFPRWRIATATESGLRASDETFTLNGTVMSSFVERRGLTFGDESSVKLISRVYPRIRTTSGSVNVRVGTQTSPDGTVTWGDTRTYTPDTTQSLSFNVKGRYLAIRFETSADMNWTMSGFDVEVRHGGRFK